MGRATPSQCHPATTQLDPRAPASNVSAVDRNAVRASTSSAGGGGALVQAAQARAPPPTCLAATTAFMAANGAVRDARALKVAAEHRDEDGVILALEIGRAHV